MDESKYGENYEEQDNSHVSIIPMYYLEASFSNLFMRHLAGKGFIDRTQSYQ
jgi:hypothetical protein